jgi:Rieske Fe-S protein
MESFKAIRPRRQFIKGITFALAYCSLGGKGWDQMVRAEITPLSTTIGRLRLRVSDFPALQNEMGSVRLAINPLRGNPATGPDGTFYPVIVNRGANNTFFALNSRCPHEGCVVDPGDGSSNLLICPCHSSLFALDGRRTGGPANTGLTRYTLTFDGQNTLEIQIPGLAYTLTISDVENPPANSPRVRLDFRVFRKVDYEVKFRESIDGASTTIPFSTTASGPADQTVFSATSSTTISLFVERKSRAGIYTVAIRVSEL